MIGAFLETTLFLLLAMCNTNSLVYDMIGATLLAALFPLHHCAMSSANSTFQGEVRAALVATALSLRTMCPANSSFQGELGASLMAASFNLRAVCNANASFLGELHAAIAAALFPLHRTMCRANSSFQGELRAFLVATSSFRHSLLRMLCNRRGRPCKHTPKKFCLLSSTSESHRGAMRERER